MLNDSKRLSRLAEIVTPICEAHGLELLDARFISQRGTILRIIIDRSEVGQDEKSSVSLADCQAVSRDVSTMLDVYEDETEPIVPKGEYRLEVSSPGIERPLYKLKDYQRFQGKEVKIQTHESVLNRKRFTGRLVDVINEDILIEQDGNVVTIQFRNIKKANLIYRF